MKTKRPWERGARGEGRGARGEGRGVGQVSSQGAPYSLFPLQVRHVALFRLVLETLCNIALCWRRYLTLRCVGDVMQHCVGDVMQHCVVLETLFNTVLETLFNTVLETLCNTVLETLCNTVLETLCNTVLETLVWAGVGRR